MMHPLWEVNKSICTQLYQYICTWNETLILTFPFTCSLTQQQQQQQQKQQSARTHNTHICSFQVLHIPYIQQWQTHTIHTAQWQSHTLYMHTYTQHNDTHKHPPTQIHKTQSHTHTHTHTHTQTGTHTDTCTLPSPSPHTTPTPAHPDPNHLLTLSPSAARHEPTFGTDPSLKPISLATYRACSLVMPVMMSTGSLMMALGFSAATSSMFTPPCELPTNTGPWNDVDRNMKKLNTVQGWMNESVNTLALSIARYLTPSQPQGSHQGKPQFALHG